MCYHKLWCSLILHARDGPILVSVWMLIPVIIANINTEQQCMTSQVLCNHFHSAKMFGCQWKVSILLLHIKIVRIHTNITMIASRREEEEQYRRFQCAMSRFALMLGKLLLIISKF